MSDSIVRALWAEVGKADNLTVLQPAGWPKPKGYANGILAEGRTVFVGGQIGWDTEGRFAQGLAAQVEQTLKNTLDVLAEAGAGAQHIARMTWYVCDIEEYLAALPEIGRAYRAHLGRHFPAMALVQVVRLVEREARVEIETTAVI
jgi:enamine deaminase RidA (YjgF/YER057c/UK114 family)